MGAGIGRGSTLRCAPREPEHLGKSERIAENRELAQTYRNVRVKPRGARDDRGNDADRQARRPHRHVDSVFAPLRRDRVACALGPHRGRVPPLHR
ncbi:hypothetical protein ACFPRL_20540 [Pseudoclavibacter helvolus]